jgi:hypothetical protein
VTRAVLWSPHPRQLAFLSRGEFEVLYGGAAGGGKSDALIVDAIRMAHRGNYRALLLRRTFPELAEILDRSRRLYPKIFPGCEYKASEHTWIFPSGARIQFGHAQHEDSIYAYQGSEYHYVGMDEAGRFTPKQYLYIFSRLRSVDPEIRPVFRATSNPGGPNHAFLKNRFKIGNVAPETTLYEEFLNIETGEIMRVSRAFVPATVYDNPTLMKADPGYIQRLLQLPEIEKQRLLFGDWSAFAGQFFHELNPEVHGFDGDLPFEWEVYRCFDWGYSKPWCCLFFAVDYDGNLWVIREIYGSKGDEDVGLKQTATEVARKIREVERELKRKVHIGPADPSIWSKRPQKDGTLGISVADEMGAEGIYWLKADNDRKLGWHQVHTRLATDDDGKPGLYIHNSCRHLWRTLPLLQENPNDTDDVLHKDAEDHPADTLRYGCMHRPMKPKARIAPDIGSFQAERRKYLKAKALAAKRGISIADAYRAR